MQCQDYNLIANREAVFSRLLEIWKESKNTTAWDNDYWRKANTLQAVAMFWNTTNNQALKKDAMNLMLEGYAFYDKHRETKWWVDDFGWWGGFFFALSSYQGSGYLPAPFDKDNLLKESKYVYSRMIQNLDTEYGGIWNNPNLGDNSTEKNTVTNTWLLIMAAGLANITLEPEYGQMASTQYKWLTTGQYKQYTPPNWRLFNSDGLILWTPDGPHTRGPNFNMYPPTALWSGNEGVYLKGLQVFMGYQTDPSAKKEILQIAETLIGKAISQSTPNGFVDVQNVMHESPIAADWSNDLATGKGVALRFMASFAKAHSIMNETLKSFLNSTAQSVWCSQDIKGQPNSVISRNWNPGFGPSGENTRETGELWPQVFQTNGLDALNAAVLAQSAVEEFQELALAVV